MSHDLLDYADVLDRTGAGSGGNVNDEAPSPRSCHQSNFHIPTCNRIPFFNAPTGERTVYQRRGIAPYPLLLQVGASCSLKECGSGAHKCHETKFKCSACLVPLSLLVTESLRNIAGTFGTRWTALYPTNYQGLNHNYWTKLWKMEAQAQSTGGYGRTSSGRRRERYGDWCGYWKLQSCRRRQRGWIDTSA